MSNEIEVYSETPTYAEEIEEMAGGKRNIEAAVMGRYGWSEYRRGGESYPNGKPQDEDPAGKVLRWSQIRPFLDYHYDAGYGSPECHAIYVWTNDKVIYCVQYDGATWLHAIPREPEDTTPEMPGG